MSKFDSVGFDYETLSLDTNCKVLSVGVVPFNRGELVSFDELRNRDSSLYIKFLLAGQERFDLVESESTREWWEQQGKLAAHVIGPLPIDVELPEAMMMIAGHLEQWVVPIKRNSSSLYCRGYDYDGAITKNLFNVTGVKSPIQTHGRWRCVRTAIDELSLGVSGYTDTPQPDHMIKHHALHDIAWDISELTALQYRQKQLLDGVKHG